MRLFQNFTYYPSYQQRLRRLASNAVTFQQQLQIFLDDRYGASHVLLPVVRADPDAFFTNWDDEFLQRAWAREAGLAKRGSLEEILLAQIEAHRTEVFYNLDPVRLDNEFTRAATRLRQKKDCMACCAIKRCRLLEVRSGRL